MTIIEIVYLIEKNRIPELTLDLLKERLQQPWSPPRSSPSPMTLRRQSGWSPAIRFPTCRIVSSWRQRCIWVYR